MVAAVAVAQMAVVTAVAMVEARVAIAAAVAVTAEAKVAIVAVTPVSFSRHARKAHVPSKAMAAANNPQVLRMSLALPAHLLDNPTRCAPVST